MSRKWRPGVGGPYRARPGYWWGVDNMIPNVVGDYQSAPVWSQLTGAGPAAPGTTRRAWTCITVAGAVVGYVGTSTKLYSTAAFNAFADISVGAYTASDWWFEQFGNYTLATNGTDQIQVRDASGVGNFANLGGTPPTTAKILAVQSNAVLAFNTNSGGHCFAASDVGNHANWTTGDAVASSPVTHRPGDFTAAVAFKDYVLAFKASSVFRLRYVGAPLKWTVELLIDGIGAESKAAAIVCGDVVVFTGAHGQYLFDGSTFRPADDGFFNTTSSIGGVVDSRYFPNTSSVWFLGTAASPPLIWVYNLKSDRWGNSTLYKSASLTQLTSYRLLMGGTSALTALGITNGEDQSILVDLALNPCVLRSGSAKWGDQGAVLARVVASKEGYGINGRGSYIGVVPTLTPHPFHSGSEATNTEMEATIYSYDALKDTTQLTSALITSSTPRCRFDCNMDARFVESYVGSSLKPFAISDLAYDVKPSGTN